MSDLNAKKRKVPAESSSTAKRPRFLQRAQAHQISTIRTATAYPSGEISLKSFLNSHQNEIKSLENAMRTAKKGLSRRAFQDVPREMRRRTASHNPQRVPKRLRARARQEAKEDNVPISRGTSGSGIGKGTTKWLRKDGIEKSRKRWEERKRKRAEKKEADVTDVGAMEGVNLDKTAPTTAKQTVRKSKRLATLATPPTPPSRFRRRQQHKTWLPTHIWHTKRAHMTPPTEPLWRFALPLAPAAKAYRLTHRAATLRGAVAWDTSYMSTMCLEGAEASIVGLLKGLRFSQETEEDPWQARGKALRWRNGTRAWDGWIYERESKDQKGIAHVIVIWCVAEEHGAKRKALIRVHPCAFLRLWNEVIRIAKVQRPMVTVEDLRFQIGSMEIMGPSTAETLCSVLFPHTPTEFPSPQASWSRLTGVTDPGILPPGALLSFPICDPRLRDPPRTSSIPHDNEYQVSLMEMLAEWPVDASQTASAIFDNDARLRAMRSLPSQKSINRRKSTEGDFGGYPAPRKTDPNIPMLVYVSKQSKSWTVLLPWKCVMPVWRAVMRYPLSTGGNPRFGGLKEKRQVSFERSIPSFPFDYPGCDAGWDWELQERAKREDSWSKRPKGKRVEWSTIDLGQGVKGEVGKPWSCDWERLSKGEKEDGLVTSTGHRAVGSPVLQMFPRDAREAVAGGSFRCIPSSVPYVFTVQVSMVQRGTPTRCARIYRLPSKDRELRDKWLTLLPSSKTSLVRRHARMGRRASCDGDGERPSQVQSREIARGLLEVPKAGEVDYPAVPNEEDLIGFVTTGNYNLAEGMPSAVGNLVLHRVLEGVLEGTGVSKEGRMCIVREAGGTTGRLARWEVV